MDTFPSPSLVDVAVLALVAFTALRGAFRGLSKELSGLISSTAALVLAVVCYEPLGGWLRMYTRVVSAMAPAVAFVVIALGVLALNRLLRLTAGRLVHVVAEDEVNLPGGVIAGLLRGLVLGTLVFAGLLLVPNERLHRRFGEESMVGTVVQRLIPRLNAPADRADALDIPDDSR